MPPELESEKPKAAALTVKVNVVVWETPEPVPVTVIEYVPAGVERVDVLTVSMLVAPEVVGVSEAGLKLHEAPEGRPEVHERVTLWLTPTLRVAVIVLEPDAPWVTVMPPELEREKSKPKVTLAIRVSQVLGAAAPIWPATQTLTGLLGSVAAPK